MTATAVRRASPRQMLSWTSGGSLLAAGAATLSAGLAVAQTDAVQYGDFAVLVALALLISSGLRLGSDKMIASEVQRSGGAKGTTCGQDLLAMTVVAGLLGFVVLAATPIDRLLNLAQSSPLTRAELVVFGIFVFADVFRVTAAEALRAQLRAALASVTGNAGRAVAFAVLLSVAALLDVEFDRTMLLTCAATASVIAAGASAFFVRQHYRIASGQPTERVRQHWRGHSAMVAATLSAAVIGAADIWLVGGFVGAEAAARYSLAVSAVGLVGILLTASHTSVQPYLAERLGRGATGEASRMSSRLAQVSTAAGSLGLLGAVLAVEPLAVAVGGDAYRGVGVLCLILGLGVLSGLVIGPAGVALIAVGRYAVMGRLAMASAGLALVTEIGAGFIARSEVPIAFCSAFAVTVLHGAAWRSLLRLEGLRTDAFASLPLTTSPGKAIK